MSVAYTTAAIGASPTGAILQHPDQPAGTGIDIPTTMGYASMAALSTAMGSDTAFFEVGCDSDCVAYRCGPTYLLVGFRSFHFQRGMQFIPREETDGSGGVKLRFVGKNARVLTLEQWAEALGLAATGLFTDSINTAAEVAAANNALIGLKAYCAIARV
jgi:hypothetical protein